MSETHYAKSIEGIKAIIESIKPQPGYCARCGCSTYETQKTYGSGIMFLPKYRIKETSDGFEIEVWYVCSGCGAVK